MPIARMIDVDIDTCRLLIRQDFNVPIQNGQITSDARIRAALPTINHAIAKGCKIMLMSHLGRPNEGEYDCSLSLLPVARCLSQLLGQEVSLITDYLDNPPNLQQGQVVLFENIRFNVGEKGNNETLARQYASLCDVFVMDAFGSAHRAQASTYGVGLFAETACAGALLASELESLSKALDNPKRPLVAIVGGSKVSTKLTLLRNLISKVDKLIVGGGIANTFLAAKGYNIGKSLYESSLVTEAKELMQLALQQNTVIAFPTDVITAKEYAQYATAHTKRLDTLDDDDMIFDIGSDTSASYREIINQAATIVWNGPVGVFEFDQFSHGTKNLAEAIAKSTAFSVAGGGDTLAAIDTYNIADQLSYISTGGGAFLECIEGKTLPAVAMLEQRYQT